MKLWQSQIKSVNMLGDSFRQGNKRTCLYGPTGSGKSEIAATLIDMALSKNKKVLFTVNRKRLVQQFSARLDKFGIKHGILQGENTRDVGSRVMVGTIQTIAPRGQVDADLYIDDECHYLPGSKQLLNQMFCHTKKYFVGLTATPFARGMAGRHFELYDEPVYQDLVVPTTIRELIDNDPPRLVDCTIYCPSEIDMAGVKKVRNRFGEKEYSHKETEKRVNKVQLIGDVVVQYFKYCQGLKTIVFAHSIAHSKALQLAFTNAGVKAAHVDGYTPDEERDVIFNDFEHGDVEVLVNVLVMKEGVDIPKAAAMILATRICSLTTWIQMCGRVLRWLPGKGDAVIVDTSGSARELGYPTDDLPLVLDDGTKPEKEKAAKEEKQKDEVICPKCLQLKKALKCDNCGYEPVIPHRVEVHKGKLGILERQKTLTTTDKRTLFAELKQIAITRKWSSGRLANQYRNITSVWPRGMDGVPPKIPTAETLAIVQHLHIKYIKGLNK